MDSATEWRPAAAALMSLWAWRVLARMPRL
jgi:hypothetical protein